MDYSSLRLELIDNLRRSIKDERLLRVMASIPRELFVPKEYQQSAYDDRPLPIGMGQTISQPFIVAMMTEALELKGDEKVLEIGTGSGYQAAILAELAKYVITVERHSELVGNAENVLIKLGYTNVEVRQAGADLGWPEAAPYDAIIVSAGAPKIPQQLVNQLVENGRMIIPVGSRYEQNLVKVLKVGNELQTVNLGPCRWVPLIGEGAWDDSMMT
jgi:protein-L-isoaspartate(D-aspartate) O-methyltransferase